MNMEINGLKAGLHTPQALKGEQIHGLPPYALRNAYAVDEYPACPDTWMHGSAMASSYFVPVEDGKGMWFDFTMNSAHAHNIAVVVSVQGVNPLTGPIKKGEIAELRLEQYRTKCPRHDTEFKQDRFCSECGYKWPAQNYIATTTGQPLWIDGFRNEKGEVRQYVLTAEEAKGVAAQLIGDKRVFAIGFAFYESMAAKPLQPKITRSAGYYGSLGNKYLGAPYNGDPTGQYYGVKGMSAMPQATWSSGHENINTMSFNASDDSAECMVGGSDVDDMPMLFAGPMMASAGEQHTCGPCASAGESNEALRSRGLKRSLKKSPVKHLEIAAGARIHQETGTDPNEIGFWKPEPTGLIYVNYVTQAECDRILAAGKRKDQKDGAFAGIQLAN